MVKQIILLILLMFFSGCSIEQQFNLKEESFNDLTNRNKSFVKDGQKILDLEYHVAYKQIEDKMSFFDADQYCNDLSTSSIDTWRLPTFIELGHIVNKDNSGVKTYDLFEDMVAEQYWTEKSSKIGNNFRTTIDFNDGESKVDHVFNKNGVVCVSKIKIK